MADLSTPVEALNGVGPRRAQALRKLGVTTLEELLNWFPRRYEDRREIRRIAELRDGESVCVAAMVSAPRPMPTSARVWTSSNCGRWTTPAHWM